MFWIRDFALPGFHFLAALFHTAFYWREWVKKGSLLTIGG
jgi:hypothetical protein